MVKLQIQKKTIHKYSLFLPWGIPTTQMYKMTYNTKIGFSQYWELDLGGLTKHQRKIRKMKIIVKIVLIFLAITIQINANVIKKVGNDLF